MQTTKMDAAPTTSWHLAPVKLVGKLILVTLALVLYACGGGGGGGGQGEGAGSSAAAPAPVVGSVAVVAGRVIDGYLSGAVVFWDCNQNHLPDTGETQAITAGDGSFSIARSTNGICRLAARVLPSSIDSDSGSSPGRAYTMFPLRSEEEGIGVVNITPLTTLAATNPVWTTEAQAIAALKDRLGITYSPSVDVLAITGDPAATHQANVARIVARLLQIGEASALVASAQQTSVKVGVVNRAATMAKALPTTYQLTPSEVTYSNWLTGSSASLISLFIDPAGSVMLVPGTGLTDEQRAYLANLIATDSDVLANTHSGTVAWHRLELKKLASINKRLRELGFYSENDSEVVRIRQRRMADLGALSQAYNIEIYDHLGTKPDAWTWNPINALRYSVLAAYTAVRPGDLVLLANNAFKFFIGEAKIYFRVPARHAFAGTIGITATDGVYKKWELVYKALEFLGNSATCTNKLTGDWATLKTSTGTAVETAKISLLTFDAITCVGDLLSIEIFKLIGKSGSVTGATTLNDWVVLTKALAELANTVIGADDANPVANQISGALDILLALMDSAEVGSRWEKENGDRIAIAQDQITQQSLKDSNTLLRRYAAMETERALRGHLQPYSDQARLQPDLCRPPLVSRGFACVVSPPSFEVVQLSQEVAVGMAVSFAIKSANIGLMPKSAYIEIEGANCAEPFDQTVEGFNQTCVFSSVGAKSVRVFQSKGSLPVSGGTIAVVNAVSAAPVISDASVEQIGAVVIAKFVVADTDTVNMRLIRVAISNDGGRSFSTCWADATDRRVGSKSITVGPNSMLGCKGVFPSTGSAALRITINIIDDSNRGAKEWSTNLTYTASPAANDTPPVISGFSLASPISIGSVTFANGTVTDDAGLVSVGLQINGIKIVDMQVSGKNVSLGSLGFDSRNTSYAGTPGTYSVGVYAQDIKGQISLATTQVTVSPATNNLAPTFSSAVATQNSDGSLTVTFTASDPEGGTVGADLYISNAGGSTFNASSKRTLTAAPSGTGRSVTWTKAEADSFMAGGQAYAVRVDAFDSAGAQTQRATNSFTRILTVVRPLTPTGSAPGNTTTTGPLLGSTASFHWDASNGATEYEVVFFGVAANAVALTVRLPGSSFLLGAYSLPGGNLVYSWRVAACNSAGCSAYTSELRFRRQ